LTGWAGGLAGEKLVNLSHEELLDRAIESLSRIFAKSAGWLHECVDKIYYHDWSNDPFCRGAYSYPKVGGLKAAQTLGEPINDTIFLPERLPTVKELMARCTPLSTAEYRRHEKSRKRFAGAN
jgi:hypothetical protein